MQVHLTLKSGNAKAGPIPVSTSPSSTCPDSCPLKASGCYAKSGPLALHWRAVDSGRGDSWTEFLSSISSLSNRQLWRHNQAGDLPGQSDSLDTVALRQLVQANSGKRGFTYTHKPLRKATERKAIANANSNGFTINLSANNPTHADQLASLAIGPVACVIPSADVKQTPAGRRIVLCPAQARDNISCATCGFCAIAKRPFIVGFLPHGTGAKAVRAIASQNS